LLQTGFLDVRMDVCDEANEHCRLGRRLCPLRRGVMRNQKEWDGEDGCRFHQDPSTIKWQIGRGDWIRTSDPLRPRQVPLGLPIYLL